MKTLNDSDPMYISSTMDLIIIIVISSVGIAINWKYLKDMNEDDRMRPPGTHECILKDVMTTYTKGMIVYGPFYFCFLWVLNEKFELPPWFQYLLCYDQYMSSTVRLYWGLNSLIIASMRYTFIVHNKRVLQFGKARVKAMFYYGSILIPILLAVLSACSVQVPANMHNLAQSICIDYYLEYHNISLQESKEVLDFGTPVLAYVHQYIPLEITGYIRTFVTVIGLLIFSNVLEGILYWKTFRAIRK